MSASTDRQTSPFELLTRELPREKRAQQGSDAITVWCACCLEKTIPLRDGTCAFCDTPLMEEAIEREAAVRTKVGTNGDGPRLRATIKRAERQERARSAPTDVKEPVTSAPRIPRRRDRRHKHGKPYTDEQILARICLWAQIIGTAPSKADWTVSRLRALEKTAQATVERHLRRIALYQLGDFPSETTVRERFGSMNAAIVQAGFSPRPTGRQANSPDAIGIKPKIGRVALEEYIEQVRGLLDDDRARLKSALYDLSLSALYWADRIAVE